MAWFRIGGGSISAALKNAMNAVLNKKMGTATEHAPETWPDEVNLMGMLEEKTIVFWPFCDFEDGADDVPTKAVQISIPPTLSGVSEVSERQTGRNLFDNTGLFPASGSVSSYYYKQFDYNSDLIPQIKLKAGVTYTLSLDITSTIEPFNFSVGCGNGSYSSDILTVYNKSNGRISVTFTPTAAQLNNGDIFAFRCPRYQAQNTFDYSISNVQLEYGSTAHDYEQYDPTDYSAELGRTIYGGEVDIVNGVGHSTCIKKTVRWGDLGNVTQLADVTRKEIVLSASEEPKYITASASTDLLNDKNLPYDMTYSGNFEHIYIANSARIWVYLPNGTDANTEITVSYTLADALQTDFTFDGQEIPTRLGYNCFISEQGDTSVTYRASGTVYNYPAAESEEF